MAKRASASTIAEDTAPKKSPEEVFKEQWPIIVAAKLEQEEAATAQTAANQAYLATLKTAKKLGIDITDTKSMVDALERNAESLEAARHQISHIVDEVRMQTTLSRERLRWLTRELDKLQLKVAAGGA